MFESPSNTPGAEPQFCATHAAWGPSDPGPMVPVEPEPPVPVPLPVLQMPEGLLAQLMMVALSAAVMVAFCGMRPAPT